MFFISFFEMVHLNRPVCPQEWALSSQINSQRLDNGNFSKNYESNNDKLCRELPLNVSGALVVKKAVEALRLPLCNSTLMGLKRFTKCWMPISERNCKLLSHIDDVFHPQLQSILDSRTISVTSVIVGVTWRGKRFQKSCHLWSCCSWIDMYLMRKELNVCHSTEPLNLVCLFPVMAEIESWRLL